METNNLIVPMFGAIGVTFTDSNHAYVSADHTHTGSVSVRGIPYYLGIHLYRWADGRFYIGEEGKNTYERRMSSHITRADKWNVSPSDSARTKIEDLVLEAFDNFATNNPGIIRDAQRQHLRENTERAESDYREAMDKADVLRRVRNAAQEAEETFLRTQGRV